MNLPMQPPKCLITATQVSLNRRTTPLSSSGSSSTARPVEPTRSQNMTVRCRRSASECGDATVAAGTFVCGVDPLVGGNGLNIRLQSPSGIRNFSRSASVRSNRTSMSTTFSAKTVTYCAKPCLSSHPAMLLIEVLVRSLSSMTPTELRPLMLRNQRTVVQPHIGELRTRWP